MKLAISANGDLLDSGIDPRFGRCKYFIFADPDTLDFVAVLNSNNAGGAGIAAGQIVVLHKAQAVLTGDCGPNAYQVLSAAGIDVYTGVSGKVIDAIADYKAGKLKASDQANVQPHHGQAAK
jgi:predicted Fe-Mo cluster-binding NifX family protein